MKVSAAARVSAICISLALVGCAAQKDADADTAATSKTTTALTGDTTSTVASTPPVDTGTWDGDLAVTACNDESAFSEDQGGGITATWINTADAAAWACFSFAEGDWDIALQQWTLRINSGRSGEGTVKGVRVDGVPFEDISSSPGGLLRDGNPPLFDSWYDYDYATHTLTPKDYVYVLESPSGTYKLEMLSYYGPDEGDVHRPWFRWAPLED